MKPLVLVLLIALAGGETPAQDRPPESPERTVESIVPWLAYNSSCWSSVELQNLGKREVIAEVEAHKSSGALAPLVGRDGIEAHLKAGERAQYKLQLTEETSGAWVRVRETVPQPQLSPVLAVSGATECLTPGELQTTTREVAWPAVNPWFSGEVSRAGGRHIDDRAIAPDDRVIALINAAERPARVSGCYSSGVLYSVPRDDRPATAELTPICSETIEEVVPPFGSRQYPVARGGNSHFSLNTRGEAIVLQMLRPASVSVKVYRVDSTVTFGKEVPGK